MKYFGFLILFSSISLANLASPQFVNNQPEKSASTGGYNFQSDKRNNIPPIAVNDTFILLSGCGNYQISGDLLANDFDPNGDEIVFYFNSYPLFIGFKITEDGVFDLTVPEGFLGRIKFEYYIKERTDKEFTDWAEVIIDVKLDSDCDNVADDWDIDDDNDGILDVDEGSEFTDSDNDGIVNSKDIDSDNDGITDNVEWQEEGYYRLPMGQDLNKNGWDDAYDIYVDGHYYKAEDTNQDGIPDFIDLDSDDDGISDFIEGCDINNSLKLNITLYNDKDHDGLDDAFDTVESWLIAFNSSGSNAPLPDKNMNGIRDWRDKPVEIENLFTVVEFSIYPNPVSAALIVNLPHMKKEEVVISLYNMSGKLAFRKQLEVGTNRLDLLNFKNGTYIVKLVSEKCFFTESLVVLH